MPSTSKRGASRGAPLLRLRIGFVLIAMVLSFFGARLVQLQGVDPGSYAAMAAAEGAVRVPLEAERGDILDRNGIPLADSIKGKMVIADPALTADRAPELARLRPTAGTGELSRALVRCADRLKAAGVDLGAFTTLQNAADLDTVRRELGYGSVNLFGTSYGARLAQQALRGDPPWIRSVTRASPIPAEANFVQDAPRSYARALEQRCDRLWTYVPDTHGRHDPAVPFVASEYQISDLDRDPGAV